MLAERINQWPKEWIQKGFKQGIEIGIIRTAKNMMRHTDFPDEQIVVITGLPLDKVRELRGDNSD